jgi:WD40 repeat protein
MNSGNLSLLTAYENGSVVLREYIQKAKEFSIEGEGWNVIWASKLHVESIMAMRVSRSHDFALTVSADHIIGRYDLNDEKLSTEQHGIAYRTTHPGNGSIAIRDDGRVCAIGGWDGRIRLHSTKSLKALGSLKYHKSACQCVEFPRSIENATKEDEDFESKDDTNEDDEEMGPEEKLERSRWLMAGAKDGRISIWPLMSFQK